MLRVTLDTNVLMSGILWDGEASKLLRLVEEKKIQCFVSIEILAEYDRVIRSSEIMDKVCDYDIRIKSAVNKIIEICSIVEPKTKILAIKEDPDDDKILECAIEAKVDYIITYDQHILKLKEFSGIKIVSPSEFLRLSL